MRKRGAEKSDGKLPDKFSFVKSDKENVIIETVKTAENSEDIIVRLYECCNRRTNATLQFGFEISEVSICDLMENEIETVANTTQNSVNIEIKPYEIVTLMVKDRRL